MLAYYGSKLSDHMTETDEGFLICQSVPIARTGYYEYLPREIGREGETPVRVFRSESEVFDPAAMASFEGKPVTLGHPPVNVTPENAASYISGHVQNVHRGKGEDADLLLADLFITDAELIRRIKDGLREVSCGYECKYTDSEGEGAQQHHIRGNHVAVVEAGRAGNRVAIKDEAGGPQAPKEGRKGKNMPKNILAKFFAVTNHDADPEAIAEVAEKLAAPVMEAAVEAAAPTVKPDDETPAAPAAQPSAFDAETAFGELKGQFDTLCEKLDELTASLSPAATADPLDELEAELPQKAETDEEQETPADADPDESITIPAESMDEDGEEEKAPASTDSAVRAAISVLKPIIARLPASERRAAADAAARQLRTLRGVQDKKAPVPGGAYAAISNARAKAAAKDAAPADDAALGKAIMARRNPHYQVNA